MTGIGSIEAFRDCPGNICLPIPKFEPQANVFRLCSGPLINSVGVCTCEYGYPSERVCICGAQPAGVKYLLQKFLLVNEDPDKEVCVPVERTSIEATFMPLCVFSLFCSLRSSLDFS